MTVSEQVQDAPAAAMAQIVCATRAGTATSGNEPRVRGTRTLRCLNGASPTSSRSSASVPSRITQWPRFVRRDTGVPGRPAAHLDATQVGRGLKDRDLVQMFTTPGVPSGVSAVVVVVGGPGAFHCGTTRGMTSVVSGSMSSHSVPSSPPAATAAWARTAWQICGALRVGFASVSSFSRVYLTALSDVRDGNVNVELKATRSKPPSLVSTGIAGRVSASRWTCGPDPRRRCGPPRRRRGCCPQRWPPR